MISEQHARPNRWPVRLRRVFFDGCPTEIFRPPLLRMIHPTDRRIGDLRDRFDYSKIDSLLVSDPLNVHYLTGFTGDSTFLWVGRDTATLLSDGRFETQIRDQCPGIKRVAIREPSKKMHQLVRDVHSAASHGRSIGFESASMTVAQHDQVAGALESSSATWIATGGLVENLRAIKDDHEVKIIERSIDVAQQALAEVMGTIQWNRSAAVTERELAFALESAMRARGASGCSFDTIVAVDRSAALPHYQPGETPIGDADVLLIDWGAMVDGYASDLTRTFYRPGDQPAEREGGVTPDEFEVVYRAVHAAHDAAAGVLRAGASAAAVDQAARSVLDREGMADRFIHATGHGFGLNVHESPRLAAGEETVLAAGMVVTIEPGVYLPDRLGIRLENDFLVTDGGCRLLSTGLPLGLEHAAAIG